jgi:hypothetical protein
MGYPVSKFTDRFLYAGFLAGTILLVSGTIARSRQVQAAPDRGKSAAAQGPVRSPKPASMRAHPFATRELNPKAKRFYQLTWGVDIVGVKLVSSGLMVRFSYRVLDAEKAKALNDKKATPLLFDQNTGAQLVVPTMEKVGQLRQSSSPEIGREYWMVFSNKEGFVKAGSRVDIVIGNFRAKGLVVQ